MSEEVNNAEAPVTNAEPQAINFDGVDDSIKSDPVQEKAIQAVARFVEDDTVLDGPSDEDIVNDLVIPTAEPIVQTPAVEPPKQTVFQANHLNSKKNVNRPTLAGTYAARQAARTKKRRKWDATEHSATTGAFKIDAGKETGKNKVTINTGAKKVQNN